MDGMKARPMYESVWEKLSAEKAMVLVAPAATWLAGLP